MTYAHVPTPGLKMLLASAVLSTALMVAPASAGLLDLTKKVPTKKAQQSVERTAGSEQMDTGTLPAVTLEAGPVERCPHRRSTTRSGGDSDGGGGMFNNGGTTRLTEKKMSQKGTTVATADEVRAPQGECG